ncbi:helix-turn-helix transcriptional regulator [Streptomyces sp. RKAG293]|uniref:helix-turn-helix domain-containing protein n=1 Tax=Streptomyces sp. RKAG293 TaxID=2893403 RepID=UPI0020344E2E|nr:helix-turn-helix transcriptional regulator [Streptomyces sp. RKAG293]MCM2417669.1 helix-turn-helix domain-containing protein [Streptomyces sp. RKAG293]
MQLHVRLLQRRIVTTLVGMTTTSPVVRRRRLGLELRALREAAGLNGDEAAKRLRWSNSKLSRIELGRTRVVAADVAQLVDLYGVKDQARKDELAVLVREANRKGWWQLYSDVPYSTYIGLEAEATTLLTYQHVIPGLFQTEEYAEAINRDPVAGVTDDGLDQQLEVRMQRQGILSKRPNPVEVRAVLDEAALRRVVGGQEVMRAQLLKLLELGTLPNVIIQVIPFSAGAHPGTRVGPFVILQYTHPADPDVIYIESDSDPYPDREGTAQRYGLIFDNLRSSAMSVAGTKAMIQKLVDEQ